MKNLRPRPTLIAIARLACLGTAAHAAAQSGTGTLAGTVIDDQGAAIPGAVVTVTEQATGALRTTTSDAEGVFRLAGLAPGRYTVSVTLDGFAPLTITDIPLAPAEIRS